MRDWFIATITLGISAWALHSQTQNFEQAFSGIVGPSSDFTPKIGPFESLHVLLYAALATSAVFLYHLYMFLFRPENDFVEEVDTSRSYVGVGTRKQAVVGGVIVLLAAIIGVVVYQAMKL